MVYLPTLSKGDATVGKNVTHQLLHKPNQFGTSRVDSPFQAHADLTEIDQNERN